MLPLKPDKLKTLLGCSLNYQGLPCQVIEILIEEEPPALVLRASDNTRSFNPTSTATPSAGRHRPSPSPCWTSVATASIPTYRNWPGSICWPERSHSAAARARSASVSTPGGGASAASTT